MVGLGRFSAMCNHRSLSYAVFALRIARHPHWTAVQLISETKHLLVNIINCTQFWLNFDTNVERNVKRFVFENKVFYLINTQIYISNELTPSHCVRILTKQNLFVYCEEIISLQISIGTFLQNPSGGFSLHRLNHSIVRGFQVPVTIL